MDSCTNGKCSINFPKFTLSNIPEDFETFVETAGTSGGTSVMSSLLTQIADQLEANGELTKQEALGLRYMANLGHMISDVTKSAETIASNCNGDQTCFSQSLETTGFDISSYDTGVNWTYTNYPKLREALHHIDRVGFAKYDSLNNPSFQNNIPLYPDMAFVDKYNDILSSNAYDSDVKAIVTELYSSIGKLSENISVQVGNLAAFQQAPEIYDPLTGVKTITYGDPSFTVPVSEIYRPQTSVVQDLGAALICATGGHLDNGQQCN